MFSWCACSYGSYGGQPGGQVRPLPSYFQLVGYQQACSFVFNYNLPVLHSQGYGQGNGSGSYGGQSYGGYGQQGATQGMDCLCIFWTMIVLIVVFSVTAPLKGTMWHICFILINSSNNFLHTNASNNSCCICTSTYALTSQLHWWKWIDTNILWWLCQCQRWTFNCMSIWEQ